MQSPRQVRATSVQADGISGTWFRALLLTPATAECVPNLFFQDCPTITQHFVINLLLVVNGRMFASSCQRDWKTEVDICFGNDGRDIVDVPILLVLIGGETYHILPKTNYYPLLRGAWITNRRVTETKTRG